MENLRGNPRGLLKLLFRKSMG